MAADSQQSDLEALLRGVDLPWGHIQLYHAEGSWQASVCNYLPRRDVHSSPYLSDPVDALRAALIEHERFMRDTQRRYDAAPKLGAGDDFDIDGMLG